MTLYERRASTPEGRRGLSAARLRFSALQQLQRGLVESEMNQKELAENLGVRKSAVNSVFRGNGNLRLNTIAEYLDAMGLEAEILVRPVGSARRDHLNHLKSVSFELPTQIDGLSHVENLKTDELVISRISTSFLAAKSNRTDFALSA